MIDPCPRCHKDRALVGFVHLCVPVPAIEPVSVTSSVTALHSDTTSVTEDAEERNRRLTRERVSKHRKKVRGL